MLRKKNTYFSLGCETIKKRKLNMIYQVQTPQSKFNYKLIRDKKEKIKQLYFMMLESVIKMIFIT